MSSTSPSSSSFSSGVPRAPLTVTVTAGAVGAAYAVVERNWACRDCGAQLQLVMSADGSPPSILCSAFPMHRLRIDLPRCTISVAVTGEWCGGGGRPGKR